MLSGRRAGLSIDTTAANSPTSVSNPSVPMFASQTGASGGTSAFGLGNPAATTASSTPSLNVPSSQPQGSSPFSGFGSGFGASTSAASSSQQLPSLFGTTSSHPTTTQPLNSSMFGPPATQPQSTLFGGGPQRPSTNIFGAPANTNTATTSLFGSSQPQPSAPQPSTSAGASKILNAFSFNPQPQQQQNVFGTSTLTLGQSTAQPGQPISTQSAPIPGVKIDITNLRPTTRFHDLAPELADIITQIDNHILAQQNQCSEISQLYNTMIPLNESMGPDIEFVTQKLDTAETALAHDAAQIDHVRGLIQHDTAEARVSFRAIDALKLPEQFRSNLERDSRDIFNLSQYGQHRLPQSKAVNLQASTVLDSNEYFDPMNPSQPRDIMDLFALRAQDMQKQLDLFTEQMHAVEIHLRGMESEITHKMRDLAVNGGRNDNSQEVVRQIVEAFTEIDGGLKAVSGRVDNVRDAVREVSGTGLSGMEKALGESVLGPRWQN